LVVPLGGGLEFRGDQTMRDEELDAFELGYRVQPLETVSLDLAFFANRYDGLMTTEGLSLRNLASGDLQGFELAANYVPSERLRVVAGYSFLDMDLALDPGSIDDPARLDGIEGANPEHQAFVRVSLSPSDRFAFDAHLRYADALPAQAVGSYAVADVRFVYRISEAMQLSIVGRNLLDDHHAEQRDANTSEVEDSLHLRLRYAF
jgi:iron complex outermembrane receptor protein